MQKQQTANSSIDDTNIKQIMELLLAGGTLSEAKGFSEDEMEAIYTLAYNLYQQESFENAEKIFAFLCFNHHLDLRFWLGLAAAREALKQFKLAIDAYSYAAMLKHDNPVPPFQAGLCYMALGQYDDAKNGFTASIHWSKGHKEHQALSLKAETLIKTLKNKKSGAKK
jgi:type III secretion system low calcium response chaperone LcrH/SycD